MTLRLAARRLRAVGSQLHGGDEEGQADRDEVPFVDVFAPLAGHEQWESDMASSLDGIHPGQAGYGLIAWLVLHHGWADWIA